MNIETVTKNTNGISTYVDSKSGDIVALHPLEQPRNLLNPFGFIDMVPVFDFYNELYQRAENQNFSARFESSNFFLEIDSEYILEAKNTSLNNVNIVFGTQRLVRQTVTGEQLLRETVIGKLLCFYYRNAETITVVSSIQGNNVSVLPTANLRSIVANNLLKLPESRFDTSSYLTLVEN